MLPTDRIPAHPGEMLVEEFLRPLAVSQTRFAEHLGIPIRRVNEIAMGKRGVTPETATLFGAALGTSPEFWMNLQAAYDLARASAEIEQTPGVLQAVSQKARASGVGKTAHRGGSVPRRRSVRQRKRARRFAVAYKKK